jgi:phosphate binding protein
VTFTGSSASLPLPDLIQATAFAGRTCRLVIRGGRVTGELGFDRGTLVGARCGGVRGAEAVLALLAVDEVAYEMRPAAPTEHDVTASWQQLVMESARLRDEALRQARRKHSGVIATPLPAPSAEPEVAPAAGPQQRRGRRWLVAVIAATVAAAVTVILTDTTTPARPEPATAVEAEAEPEPEPAPVAAGRIVVKGSDTIGGAHGLGPALAKAFEDAHPGTRVVWEGLGSATAFVGLLDGSADVGASSRAVKAEEQAEAERLGLRFTEYVLGYDGIAVIVHPEAPVAAISMPELARVFSGEIKSWRQLAGPRAPDAPIRLVARPAYSGTHAFFRDKVLRGAPLSSRTEWIEASEELVLAVAADRYALSFVGMGNVTPAVRILAIAPSRGAPALRPQPDTIRAGTYPINRPLLLYVRGLPTPAVAELLRFCSGDAGQAHIASPAFGTGGGGANAIVAGDRAVPAPTIALRVTFATGSATIDPDARIALGALAIELRADPHPLVIAGHADAERGHGSNLDLARDRAEAVAALVRSRGVDSRLLRVESAGDAAPVATNRTATGRDQNRRVDILIAPPADTPLR